MLSDPSRDETSVLDGERNINNSPCSLELLALSSPIGKSMNPAIGTCASCRQFCLPVTPLNKLIRLL